VSSTDWEDPARPAGAKRVDPDEVEAAESGSADAEERSDTVGTEGTAGVTDRDVTEGGGMVSGLGGGTGAERSEGAVAGAGGWTSGVTGDPGSGRERPEKATGEETAGREDENRA
jgi:hypothetical protein